jgi:hypothetical protein
MLMIEFSSDPIYKIAICFLSIWEVYIYFLIEKDINKLGENSIKKICASHVTMEETVCMVDK